MDVVKIGVSSIKPGIKKITPKKLIKLIITLAIKRLTNFFLPYLLISDKSVRPLFVASLAIPTAPELKNAPINKTRIRVITREVKIISTLSRTFGIMSKKESGDISGGFIK